VQSRSRGGHVGVSPRRAARVASAVSHRARAALSCEATDEVHARERPLDVVAAIHAPDPIWDTRDAWISQADEGHSGHSYVRS
jgi:hypothetical protein